MAGMSPSQIIVLATPVFFALIAIEFVVGLRRGRNTYRFDDALNSISLGMLSQASVVLVPPNPNELFSARRIFAARGRLGT